MAGKNKQHQKVRQVPVQVVLVMNALTGKKRFVKIK